MRWQGIRIAVLAFTALIFVSACRSSGSGPSDDSASASAASPSAAATTSKAKPTGTLPPFAGTADKLCSFDGGDGRGASTTSPESLVLTFVTALIHGSAASARSCVYPHTVPASKVNALAAKTLVNNPSCYSCLKFISSTKSTSHFVLRQEATTFDVTIAQDAAGNYWITAVTVTM